VRDSEPGIRRRGTSPRFRYTRADGRPAAEADTERARKLVIPPAWTDVWICESPRGHLQATGRDARGRKQYRYHPQYREVRETAKYERLPDFARALPAIRRRIARDLSQPGLPRTKVLAAALRIMESTLIRIGNDEYAKANGSYGLTTLRNRHVAVAGSEVTIDFIGKGGKRHKLRLQDPRLARIIKRCRELPGQELLQYLDDDGVPQRIGSGDINDYLREITGEEFTAKDYRTWGGTLIAAATLAAAGAEETQTAQKRTVAAAMRSTAEQLGNTATITRKCYVHPAVIDAYERGEVLDARVCSNRAGDLEHLRSCERAVLALIEPKRTRRARAA
jgi:DNA topoisomerase-1